MISDVARAALDRLFPQVVGLPGWSWEVKRVFQDLGDDPTLLLVSKDEFEAGMRESFLEGQRFARENSLEGALEKTGKVLADAGEAMKHVTLPTPIWWDPKWGPPPARKDIPPRGLVIHHSPRPMRPPMSRVDMERLKGKLMKEFLRKNETRGRERT